jgi:hypothetical protein
MKGYCVQTGSYLSDLHAHDGVDANISSFGFAVTVDGAGLLIKKILFHCMHSLYLSKSPRRTQNREVPLAGAEI